ncbi:hypothetical protein ASPVEDRAFT_393022 [Aspergillus versicolor CBS 583.65]|uniref:Uncharacterized protein n=1 Tax=Aspergillus versicolor CBS 583.65 TaxID=1036611 RepID=A0A1L9Q3F8_ASPVE|nr:uncharacterized protein ASPVEDRAFT_393022 [Aspergillus versicolor CBS 583.65]OJJ08281.1 hypothetical protein ASPVEDRAFT_393022 [Aspergillus versicolor CBS 583.65]
MQPMCDSRASETARRICVSRHGPTASSPVSRRHLDTRRKRQSWAVSSDTSRGKGRHQQRKRETKTQRSDGVIGPPSPNPCRQDRSQAASTRCNQIRPFIRTIQGLLGAFGEIYDSPGRLSRGCDVTSGPVWELADLKPARDIRFLPAPKLQGGMSSS